jgi:hypothetical protein
VEEQVLTSTQTTTKQQQQQQWSPFDFICHLHEHIHNPHPPITLNNFVPHCLQWHGQSNLTLWTPWLERPPRGLLSQALFQANELTSKGPSMKWDGVRLIADKEGVELPFCQLLQKRSPRHPLPQQFWRSKEDDGLSMAVSDGKKAMLNGQLIITPILVQVVCLDLHCAFLATWSRTQDSSRGKNNGCLAFPCLTDDEETSMGLKDKPGNHFHLVKLSSRQNSPNFCQDISNNRPLTSSGRLANIHSKVNMDRGQR